jgi:hypothetical protein
MSILSQIAAAFQSMRGMLGGVEIVNGDNTASAIVKYANVVEYTKRGAKTQTAGTARALYSELGDVSRTKKITVGGVQVFVLGEPEIDAAGACIVFQFASSLPVE